MRCIEYIYVDVTIPNVFNFLCCTIYAWSKPNGLNFINLKSM